jgi:hypothetical protein
MSTQSPTVAFNAGYYGVIGFAVLVSIIVLLLCCSFTARVQNDAKAFQLRRKITLAQYAKMKEKPDDYTPEQWRNIELELHDLSSQQGFIAAIADSVVEPLTKNDVATDMSLFFYHTGMGKLILLSFEGLLNLTIGIVSLVFTGMTISYINTYVLPHVQNPGQTSFNIIVFLACFVLLLTIARDQYRVFMRGRIGDTGVVEPLNQVVLGNALQQKFN